jgi:hypothetical protein
MAAITGGRFNEMWAQNFDGAHSYSVTVQGRAAGSICETNLIGHWGTEDHSASDIFITQAVSANGVEEFPKENRTGSDLVTKIYRDGLSSVTFKCECFNSKAMGHWSVYDWQ